jgi:hypothetical protein
LIPLEHRALDALEKASMRTASTGKRFRNDIRWRVGQDPEYKLTKRQSLYLWSLVYMYRRQVADPELRRLAEHRKVSDELPEIYLEGDHREPEVKRGKKESSRIQNQKRKNRPVQVQENREEIRAPWQGFFSF